MIREAISVNMPNSNPEQPQPTSRLSPSERRNRKNRALKSIYRYVVMSAGMGFIPAPLYSQVAVSGVLVAMLTELCQEFDVKISNQKTKAAVASVLGGAHSGWIAYYSTKHIDRFVPGISVVAGIVARPIAAGTITYAIGRLFLHHLETGAWKS